jgi:hypothetical protein
MPQGAYDIVVGLVEDLPRWWEHTPYDADTLEEHPCKNFINEEHEQRGIEEAWEVIRDYRKYHIPWK